MLCGMVSNNPVALCHPLPYGRRAAPSKKDSRALEGKTNNYATLVPGQRRDVGPTGPVTSVAIGPVRPSPPSLTPSRPLHHHPQRCGSVRRRDDATAATVPLYGLTSTRPPNPHTGGRRTGDPYAATLEAAPGRAQDAPRRPARSKIRQVGRLLRDAVHHTSTCGRNSVACL
jgi:hypothetical protein